MGKILGFLLFFILFIIFSVIKKAKESTTQAYKTAYDAVFDEKKSKKSTISILDDYFGEFIFDKNEPEKNTKFSFDEDNRTNDAKINKDIKIIANCMQQITLSLQKNYDGDVKKLHYFIVKYTQFAESYLKENDFDVNKETAIDIVYRTIVSTGYATNEEIQKIIKSHEDIEKFKSEYARYLTNKFETNNYLFEETDRKKEVLASCMAQIASAIQKHHTGDLQNLANIIVKLTPVVQSFISNNGYEVSSEVSTNMICRTIIYANIASREEVQSAQRLFF